MTRRITLAIGISVLVSVLLAGVGTLVTTRFEDRKATLEDLEAKAAAVTFLFEQFPLAAGAGDDETVRARLRRIQEELRLADAEFLVFTASGEIFGELPAGLPADEIDTAELTRTGQVSGTVGSTIYAVSYSDRRQFDFAVVLTADNSRLTSAIARWILVSTLVALAAGAVVAWALGRRLAEPIVAASLASRRIAGGDLTARVAADPGRNDEIGELATAINEMAVSLDRSRGLERQFLLSVSHDLRTPLTSIRGYAEAIADGAADDPTRAAGVIGSEARRLERLVTDLLDLARLDARQFRLHPQNLDLHDVIPDVTAGFEHQATQAGIRLEVDGQPGPLLVSIDPDRFAQVLANLLENALKYANERITVTYRRGSVATEVVVADDGPGIATEDLPHVFERLYVTTQTPVRKESGSGLGLAIARELITAMGGSIQAIPRPTGGTQLVISLPTPAAAA